jgi:hypothetical protein
MNIDSSTRPSCTLMSLTILSNIVYMSCQESSPSELLCCWKVSTTMIFQNSVANDAHLTELFDLETWLANDATSLALMHQKTKVNIFTTAATATRSWPSRCLQIYGN